MTLMTADAYIDSLRRMRKRVFMFGEEIEDPTDHPMIRPSVNAVAMTYELSHRSDHEALLTAESSLTGKRINRFTHLHQSTDDLVKKVNLLILKNYIKKLCIILLFFIIWVIK